MSALTLAIWAVSAFGAKTLVSEVTTDSYGIQHGGKLVFRDYYIENEFVFYAVVKEYNCATGQVQQILPAGAETPYYIYYALSGNHLPYIMMQSGGMGGGGGGLFGKRSAGPINPPTGGGDPGGYRGGSWAVYLNELDMASYQSARLIQDTAWKQSVWAGGQYVVWVDYRHYDSTTIDSLNGEIYVYNHANGQQIRITETHHYEDKPFTDGVYLAWVDYRQGSIGNIYFRALGGGQAAPASATGAHQDNPRVHGDWIIWEDYRNADSDPLNADIYAYHIPSGEVKLVCTADAFQGNPYLYGTMAVWEDYRHNSDNSINADLIGYDLAANEEAELVVEAGYQGHPTLYGDMLCWLHMDPDSTMALYIKDISESASQGAPDRANTAAAGIAVRAVSGSILELRGAVAGDDFVGIYDVRGRRVWRAAAAKNMRLGSELAPGTYRISLERGGAIVDAGRIVIP
jgi:hypothetical protein